MMSCHKTPSQGDFRPEFCSQTLRPGAERVRLPETPPDSREAAPQMPGTAHGLASRTHCPPHRETRGVPGGQAQVRTRDGGPGGEVPRGETHREAPDVSGCGERWERLWRPRPVLVPSLDHALSVSPAHTLQHLRPPHRRRRALFSRFSHGSHHLPKYAII